MRQNKQPSTPETLAKRRLEGALDDLERWAAAARAQEAADERVRARWLRQAAEEDATFTGVLLDLAEGSLPVTLTTTTGHRHGGRLIAVGRDFVAVRTGTGLVVLVALAAVADVVAPGAAGSRPASGEDRPQPLEVTLADVLAQLSAARPRASLRAGEAVVSGDLVAVGSDVVTVAVGGSHPPRLAYVRLDSVSEVTVFEAG